MSNKGTLFYRKKTAISLDFTAEEISSDGSVILLEKLERQHGLLNSLDYHFKSSERK